MDGLELGANTKSLCSMASPTVTSLTTNVYISTSNLSPVGLNCFGCVWSSSCLSVGRVVEEVWPPLYCPLAHSVYLRSAQGPPPPHEVTPTSSSRGHTHFLLMKSHPLSPHEVTPSSSSRGHTHFLLTRSHPLPPHEVTPSSSSRGHTLFLLTRSHAPSMLTAAALGPCQSIGAEGLDRVGVRR